MVSKEIVIRSARRELFKRSFYHFFLYFWSEVSAEDFVDNWHVKALCDELQKIAYNLKDRKPKEYDLIINIPPGTSKSTITSILFPCYLWTLDPTLKILNASHGNRLSHDHSVKSRNVLQSEKFRELYPEIELKPDNNVKSFYENTEMGARVASSVGSNIIGSHYHLHLVDDPVSASPTPNEIENANEWIFTGLSTRKVNKTLTPLILIMQRVHLNDPTAMMLQKGIKVKHICLPAETSNKISDKTTEEYKQFYVNGLLDPNRLNRDVLTQSKKELGSKGYSAQFLQNPVDDEGTLIKVDQWFRVLNYHQFNLIANGQTLIPHYILDTALTDKQQNDPTCLLSYYFIDNQIFVFNVETEHLNPATLNTWVENKVKANGYGNGSLINVESAAAGYSLLAHLKNKGYRTVDLGKPTKDKVWRANQCLPEWEGGRVSFLEGSYLKDFKEELSGFPNLAAHDDRVDCLIYATEKHLLKKRKLIYGST